MMLSIILVLFGLNLAVAAPGILPNGWPWEERKHFLVDVMEAGNKFREDVDMDLERGIEIIRVPPHNNIGAVIFVNDYHRNQTMRYLAADNMCFLSTLAKDAVEGSHESLDDVVQDFELEQELPSDAEVDVEVSEWRVGKMLQDITEIGDVMQRLCAGHDIYRLEMTRDTMHVSHDGAAPRRQEKRYSVHDTSPLKSVQCPMVDVRERCKLQWDCSYLPYMKFYTCKNKPLLGKNQGKKYKTVSDCRSAKHMQETIRCCIYCCNSKEKSDNVKFPYCEEVYNDKMNEGRKDLC